jgi:hypothetical protein
MYFHPNRTLLLVADNANHSNVSIDVQLQWLHKVLYTVENINTYSEVNEIIDINRYKVIRKKHLVAQILRAPYMKPFEFVCCKN